MFHCSLFNGFEFKMLNYCGDILELRDRYTDTFCMNVCYKSNPATLKSLYNIHALIYEHICRNVCMCVIVTVVVIAE